MFACLRFNALIGGDDQQHQINPANSGQHVADEALVTGNIHKPEAQAAVGSWHFEMGEAKVNGYSAPLLFFQTVGVNSC